MAKYILSDGTDRFKGSLQGSTFQKCGQVFSIRKHNTPVQKRSPKQSASKNRFEFVQTSFRKLDISEQQTFADQSINFPRINSLGETYYMPAITLHSSANNSLAAAGQPVLTEMESPVVYPALSDDLVALRPSMLAMDIIVLPVIIPSGFSLRVEATRPLSNGVLAVESDFLQLGVLPENSDQSLTNWYTIYTSRFGSATGKIGQTVAARSTLVSNTNGQPGPGLVQYGFVEP